MATVSGGFRVNAAVNAGQTATSGASPVIYTAPANGYAILNLQVAFTVSGSVQIGGRTVYTQNGAYVVSAPGSNSATTLTGGMTIYVGPSQAITVTSGGVGNNTANVTGVEFVNV